MSEETISLDENCQTAVFSNGLRLIHKEYPSNVSYCGVIVNVGTRDELPHEWGMAHFIEHMLFKGTTKRRAHHIGSRMENVGGDLNAYTTKEETYYYTTFLENYAQRAIELLSDMLFNSVFPQAQIEREKDVVLDEILSYDDSPSEQIFDDFENQLFYNHPIGHYILGTQQTLNGFSQTMILDFYRRYYVPNNMVFFYYGKTPFSTIYKLIERYFSHIPSVNLPPRKEVAVCSLPTTVRVEKSSSQTHVMMGVPTFNKYHEDAYPLMLFNALLGGGTVNSRLNRSLRERHGLVYNVESNVILYSDTGQLSIYFACDPKYIDKCLRLIDKEIKLLQNQPLSPHQLSQYKRQWKGQIAIAAENNENTAINMAKSWLYFGSYPSLSKVFDKIDAVSSLQIQDIAQRMLGGDTYRLIYQ